MRPSDPVEAFDLALEDDVDLGDGVDMDSGLAIADRHTHEADGTAIADHGFSQVAVDVAFGTPEPRRERAHEARFRRALEIP